MVKNICDPGGKSGYLLIDRSALRANFEKIQRYIGRDVGIIPVVKGNCYGYGSRGMTELLTRDCGAKTLGVGALCEGLQMRRDGVTQEIMLIGGVYPQQYALALENDILVPLFDSRCAQLLNDLARQQRTRARVQIKIDTGMNRLGVRCGEPLEALLETLRGCEHLAVEGVYTHFATATEQVRDSFVLQQHERFETALRQVKAAGLQPVYIHCCNSAAMTWFREAYHSHVRLGGTLYGQLVMEDGHEPVDVQSLVTLRAFITNVHTLPAGESVSYAQKFRSERDLQIATISLGFADGIPPQYAKRQGPLIVRGVRTRFLDICMDQAIVDVTGIPCAIGDEVTLLGRDGEECISVQSVEKFMGLTFEYLLTFLGDRIAREYL